MKKIVISTVFVAVALGLGTAPRTAEAQAKRKNVLDGQPEVRHRVLYLRNRFEINAEVGLSFLEDFRHNFLAGVRLEYHILDFLSVGAFVHAKVVHWDTELTNEMEATLPNVGGTNGDLVFPVNSDVDPSPPADVMKRALDSVTLVTGFYVAYYPWFGKLSLFGRAFGDFEFFVNVGVGLVLLKAGSLNQNTGCDRTLNSGDFDPTGVCDSKLHIKYEGNYKNGGLKIGPLVGFGIKIWLRRWVALTLNFQDVIIKRNAAGFDRTGDTDPAAPNVLIVNSKDESLRNVMSFTFGASFFLPVKAPRSK